MKIGLVKNPMAQVVKLIATATMALVLSACGGGGGDSSTPTPSPSPTMAATGTIAGTVVSTVDGAPIANVDITAGAITGKSAADGSFQLRGVMPGARVLAKAENIGYASTAATTQVVAGQSSAVRIVMTPVAATASVPIAAGGTVSVPNSPAQVTLPANGLVDASTRAAVTGNVTVRLTPIDPARNASAMPGDYLAQGTGGAAPTQIESFGALKVDLRDATGRKLDLAAGQTSTIRIPVATRSADLPATIPLYYFDETTGLWVQEGTATLRANGANAYYEGTVSHFTTWNCDRLLETIQVRGCVVDAAGNRVANVFIGSTGLDYSGNGNAVSNANGDFVVPMRRGGIASIYGEIDTRVTNIVQVGPSQSAIDLPECLRLGAPGVLLPPVIVKQPQSAVTNVDDLVRFDVQAIGSFELRYQWSRNGQPIDGATSPWLFLIATQADNGARYTVTVTNAAGSVTSAVATLTVNALMQPAITQQPANVASFEGIIAAFSVQATGGALRYQWRRNGVAIAGATSSVYVTPTLALTDNGSTFDVIVSNSVGSVTSAAATLTVTVNNFAAITRLAFLAFDYIDLAQTSFQLIDDNGKFLSSAQVCGAGGSVAGTLNGAAVQTGAALPTGSNTLAATFTNCGTDSITSYSGASSVQYTLSAPLTGNFDVNGTGTMTASRRVTTDGQAMPKVESDLTGNGTVSYSGSQRIVGAQTTGEFTGTPAAGATLRSGLSNLTATAVSGSVSVRTVETALGGGNFRTDQSRFSSNGYTYTVGSNTYVSNGTLQTDINGSTTTSSGEIVVTRDGTRIGRIFVDANGVIQVEANGQIVPFRKSAATLKRAKTR